MEIRTLHRILPIALLLLTIFPSCYKEHKLETVKPTHLITQQKLTQIITDMQLIEAAVEYDKVHGKYHNQLEKEYYHVLSQRYQVSPKQIRESINYYTNQDDVMANIYDKVLSNLSQKQAVLDRKRIIKEAQEQFKQLEKEFRQLNMGGSFREDSIARICFNPII